MATAVSPGRCRTVRSQRGEMRNLVIVAIWIGIGFAVTEFVASALEKSRVDEHLSLIHI